MENEDYSIQGCLERAKEKFREILKKNIPTDLRNPEYKKIKESIEACFLSIKNCNVFDDIGTPDEIIAGSITFSDEDTYNLYDKKRCSLMIFFKFKKDGTAVLTPVEDEYIQNKILKDMIFAPWDVVINEIIDLSKKHLKIDEPSSIIIEKHKGCNIIKMNS